MTAAFILVVDDDQDIRETVVEVLADEGYEVIGASDGAEALRVMRAASSLPALIFLDLMMPGMSGADFLVAQRADPALVAAPVVLISADADLAVKAANLGVTEFLRKPVRLKVLLETAQRLSGVDARRTVSG